LFDRCCQRVAASTPRAEAAAATIPPIAEGPWAARRIGYRPGSDTDGDRRIVLARFPILLALREVREAAACTRARAALAAPGETLATIRAMPRNL